jgi:hypothetical protein
MTRANGHPDMPSKAQDKVAKRTIAKACGKCVADTPAITLDRGGLLALVSGLGLLVGTLFF